MKRVSSLIFVLFILFISSAFTYGQAIDVNATNRGISTPSNPGLTALNDVLQSFAAPAPIDLPWGVAHDGTYLYITDPLLHPTSIFQVNSNGTPTGRVITVNEGQGWIGDMASDGTFLYACLVGGSNNIVKINIVSGNVVETISGEWNYTSQRGLAYDKEQNEFYIGGWNSNTIWRINASTGATISSHAFISVSGLAWHPKGGLDKQGSLWVVTNADPSTITELNPFGGWSTLQTLNFPESSIYSGAGAEIDPTGALWVAVQNEDMLKLVDLQQPMAVPISKWAIASVFFIIFGVTIIRFRRIL